MSGSCFLGVDVGTSGVKAILVNATGDVEAAAITPLQLSTPQPGWAEQDPEAWWQASVASIRQSVVDILGRAARAPTARLITYGDRDRADSRVETIYHELAALVEHPVYDPADVAPTALEACSASALAGKLAAVFDLVRRSP